MHGFFTKSRTKNVTFKLTIWIHNRALKIKGSATYNFNIICILTTKSSTKNNIFIKKGRC